VRASAADSLGEIARRSDRASKIQLAVQPLERLLNDQSAKVRARATWALGCFGAEANDAIPSLITVLRDSDPQVQEVAYDTIRKLAESSTEVVQLLRKELNAKEIARQTAAVRALRETRRIK
jgi:HEAT repeat protein